MNAVAKSPVNSQSIEERYFSIEEYYAREEKSLNKHEYHAGKIIRTTGAKYKHNRFALIASTIIENFIDANDLPFEVNNSDTKIRIEASNKIVYPDAVVICGVPEFYNNREDTVTNPTLVIEVLSPSTQVHDKTTKFEMYRTIPSFKEYVLINQDVARVSVWSKQNDNKWILTDFDGLNTIAILTSIENCPLSLSRLYKKRF